jgi:hypothetical protein
MQVWHQLEDQVSDQLLEQVWPHIWNQVEDQSRGPAKVQFREAVYETAR